MVKIENFPIPEVIDPPRKCLCIEIPWDDEHKRIIAGLLWQLTNWYNWQRDPDKRGKDVAAVYKDVFAKIDWSDMSCCCGPQPGGTPTMTRLNPVTYIYEISIDGGTTWGTDPTDPRQTGFQYPPLPESTANLKCQATQNLFDGTHAAYQEIAGIIGGASALVAAAALIAGVLIVLITRPTEAYWLIPVVLQFAGSLMGETAELINGEWDEKADDLFCFIYSKMGENGQLNQSGFDDIVGHVAGYPSLASAMLQMIYFCWQLLGCNNAASITQNAADTTRCAGCGCACDLELWVGWDGLCGTITHGTDATGCYVQAVAVQNDRFGGGSYGIVITTGVPNVCCKWVGQAMVSGNTNVTIADACGTAIPPSGGSVPGGAGIGSDINLILFASSAGAFTIKIYFE